MIKQRELNKRYSDRINYYLNNGYWINSSTMSGSQGELAHVDLINEKELVRVIIERDYEASYEAEKYFHYEFVRIYEKRFEYSERFENKYSDSIWNNRGELIYEEKWYTTHSTDGVYFTKAEIDNVQKIQLERCKAKEIKSEHEIVSADVNKLIKLVNNHQGYKSVRKGQITALKVAQHYYDILIKNKHTLTIYKKN